MLKICSGQATDEEISKWFDEQGIPIEDKDQVLLMLYNSFNVGESMAEKIYPSSPVPILSRKPRKINTNLNNTNNFPGCTKEDIMARLGLVLSELDTIRSQVITLIDQVNMLN